MLLLGPLWAFLPPPFTCLFSSIRKWPRTPHQWKRMCTVLWQSFILKDFQEGVNSMVKQPCSRLNSFSEDGLQLRHHRRPYKYQQNKWSNKLKFAKLKTFLQKKHNKTGPSFFLSVFFFYLEAELGSQLCFRFSYNFKTHYSFSSNAIFLLSEISGFSLPFLGICKAAKSASLHSRCLDPFLRLLPVYLTKND